MRFLAVALTLLLSSAMPAAAAATFVIIASSETSGDYAAGAVLEAGQDIAIADGTQVTLLSKTGDVVKLKGPYSGALLAKKAVEPETPASWSSSLSEIAELVLDDPKQSSVIGATRELTVNRETGEPDIWVFNVDSSGNRCVKPPKVELWRKDPGKSVSLSLRTKSIRYSGLTWEGGRDRYELPDTFVKDDMHLVMAIDKKPRRFDLHVLPKEIRSDSWGAVLHWMIKNECTRQAHLLIGWLHEAPE